MDKKLILTRDKHIITIFRPDIDKKLKYDLKLKCMLKEDRNGTWRPIKAQYSFFEGLTTDHIECAEEHFKELILFTKKLNPYCTSLSTFFARMNQALVYEGYIQQGVKVQCHVSKGYRNTINKHIVSKPVDFYHAHTLKFFKRYSIELTEDIENCFIRDFNLAESIFLCLDSLNLEREQIESFVLNQMSSSYDYSDLVTLVKTYRYDVKALLDYVINYLEPFENMPPRESIRMLKDYYELANQMGRDAKKYPKYLNSMHDIFVANYKAFKRNYDERRFEELAKKELEHEDKTYCIIVPTRSKEIISEGTNLNHCVGSYVDKILKGQTYIFFLRMTEHKETSLITLELINNRLVQAKGSYNRLATDEEKKFLEKYCKLKDLQYGL